MHHILNVEVCWALMLVMFAAVGTGSMAWMLVQEGIMAAEKGQCPGDATHKRAAGRLSLVGCDFPLQSVGHIYRLNRCPPGDRSRLLPLAQTLGARLH